MSTTTTDAQVDAAIAVLERAIDAARNSNQAGEDAVLKMAGALDLYAALERIAGGHFDNASTLAIEGRWHEAFNELQKIARAAISEARGETSEG